MLDEKHPSLSKLPNDANTCALGSIVKHNVVIACSPEGMIGTKHAAIIATRISTFRAVKVGLMVGIGRSIPLMVSLGDVVVSKLTDQYSGVVQWDMRKAESGGKLKRIGSLITFRLRSFCRWLETKKRRFLTSHATANVTQLVNSLENRSLEHRNSCQHFVNERIFHERKRSGQCFGSRQCTAYSPCLSKLTVKTAPINSCRQKHKIPPCMR